MAQAIKSKVCQIVKLGPYNILHKVPSESIMLPRTSIYSFAFGPSVVGRSKSLISQAASLSQKLMRSLPNPLLTMLNWMLDAISHDSIKRLNYTYLFSLIIYAIPKPSSIT